MLEVKGFRGIRFDPAKTGSLDRVATPPYDVISDAERAALAALSPHNYVHVILPEPAGALDKYQAARATLGAWRAEGALVQDEIPSFYLFRQRFTDLYGDRLERRGFFAAVKLPEPGERSILGHERTFPKPVQDRYHLTEAVEANLEPVFALYPDPDGVAASMLSLMAVRPPDAAAVTSDGVEQAYWCVPQDDAVAAYFQGKTLYIADGHHRFQTACAYRDARRAAHGDVAWQPYDFCLMGLVAMDDPGLRIYPTHRLAPLPPGFDVAAFLAQLEQWFDVLPCTGSVGERLAASPAACAIGMAIHGAGDFLLELRPVGRVDFLGDDRGPAWRDLDVAVLHRGILECTLRIPEGTQFGYEKDRGAALDAVHAGEHGLAFLLRPPRMAQVKACADAAEPMPQKSTYFFPKLASGLVYHALT